MRGARGFYSPKHNHTKRPLRYVEGKRIVADTDQKPYLFAFNDVAHAWCFITCEFGIVKADGPIVLQGRKRFFNPGRIEIWEAKGEQWDFQAVDLANPKLNIANDFYDTYIMDWLQPGTVLCKSLTLTKKVTL